MDNGDAQAYPCPGYEHTNNAQHHQVYGNLGLTKREVIAKDICVALASNLNVVKSLNKVRSIAIATVAAHLAEELLDTLSKIEAVKSKINK